MTDHMSKSSLGKSTFRVHENFRAPSNTLLKPKPTLELQDNRRWLEFSKQSIFFESWTKYTKRPSSPSLSVTSFFSNPNFLIQSKLKIEMGNPAFIPSAVSHFLILTEKHISLNTSRVKSQYSSTDIIQLNLVLPVKMKNELNGGVVDFGEHNREFCSKIITGPSPIYAINQFLQMSDSEFSDWIFCFSDYVH